MLVKTLIRKIKPHKRWRVVAWVALGSAALILGCGGGDKPGPGPKVIVLGFDGMDPKLAEQFMASGVMPNFAKVRDMGGFQALGTSVPPLSPVAWSNFITGMDSGGHGIFDFIHRDPETLIPYLSTTRTGGGGRTLKLGKWQIPLEGGTIELLRQGEAFWEVLERNGVETTVLRMPANFPPSETASRELTGMGTTDVMGSYGTFSFYTSVLFAFEGEELSGGKVYEAWEENGVVDAVLYGPPNPFLQDQEDVTIPFQVFPDPEADIAKLEIGDEQFVLKIGEWSDWVPVSFELAPTQSLGGMCRFYLRSVRPEFELYVSPINWDPVAPGMPVSSPPDYAAILAEATGRFYTQGMPEDTHALRGGVLTRDEFLAQAAIAGEEIRDQYGYVLDRFQTTSQGDNGQFLFYYFGNLDQISHMMYRVIDPEHPAYDVAKDGPYEGVIEELYRQADEVVGQTLDNMEDDTMLVIMSDHGFSPLRRKFSVNNWLRENGYITARDMGSSGGLYPGFDWSKTQAYGIGLNSIYINLDGRDRDGSVDPAQRDALMKEIAEKLLTVIDPETGTPPITKVYLREEIYKSRGHIEIGPDLLVGYARGYGGSDQSALGGFDDNMFYDNTEEWTGDHGMDHEVVPGILLTTRPLKKPATSLKNLASSILAEYGIEGFPAVQESPGP